MNTRTMIPRTFGLIAIGCLTACGSTTPSSDHQQATQSRPIVFPREPVPMPPTPAPDPVRGNPVVWLIDRYVYEDEAKAGTLDSLVLGSLMMDYAKQRQIEPTAAQLRSCREALKFPSTTDPEERAYTDRITRAMVMQWIVSRALYEQYGGAVIFQQMNPMEPVGAYRAFLEEQERLGTFKILDPAARDKFWSYYTRTHPMQYTPDQIDFSRPWWERSPR